MAQASVGMTAPGSAAAAGPRDARDLAEQVREAVARPGGPAPLRVVGAGSWLDGGRPVRDDAAPLHAGALTGIVEYVPGDLTLTARAGTPLGEIARITAAEGQWLALDPICGTHGTRATLGATVATASTGPLAHAFGPPRDNVLGIEAVTGSGEIVRGGGRVVKNVAGFDLVRLFTGAWGTLGVLTEVTVRLRAMPADDETIAMELPEEPALVRQLLARIAAAPLAPWALETVSPLLAHALGLGERPMLLARLAGGAALVRAQHQQLSMMAATELAPDDTWSRLRAADATRAAVVRWSVRPGAFADAWHHARTVAREAGGWAHGSAGRGVVRVVVPLPQQLDDEERAALQAALLAPFAGTRVGERLPPALWPGVAPSPAADRLSRGVRAAFDPHHVLNPGILGEPTP